MTTKTKVIASIVVVATSFAFGRYSVNQPSIKTKEEIKTDSTSNTDKDTRTTKTKVTVKTPDGTEKTTETTDTTTTSKTTKQTDSDTNIQQIVESKSSRINISVLGANDFSRGALIPTYGISASKEFIGPITVGAFGLMNGVVGVSIGLDF